MASCSVNVVVSGSRCDLLVSGELDVLTANLVEELGQINLESSSIQRLVLDLRDVTFMDGRGIRVLLRLRQGADSVGKTVALSHPHPPG